MNNALYAVTERNVDGCGGDATEFVQFSSPLNDDEKTSFQNILLQVKQQNSGDMTTSDMVEDAVSLFNALYKRDGSLCLGPFAGTFDF